MICYKFRLYPNKTQQTMLWNHANALNRLYNHFLHERIEAYKKDGTTVGRFRQQSELKSLKEDDHILKEIHSQVLQQVPLRLDKTYQSFFKRKHGFPKFRSCQKFFGICYPQKGYSIENGNFITKIYGKMTFIRHRDIRGNIRQVYITVQNNKWYICVTTDYEIPTCADDDKQIGIDVGITNVAALSNGRIIPNVGHAKYFDKIINRLKSKRDSSCKKGSRRFRFLSHVVQRLYDVKSRKIRDFLHKLSRQLSNHYDTIFVEDLDLKEMSESEKVGINRELRNSQIAKFVSYLQYKTKLLIKVNPRNTSKTCNLCGRIKDMPLSQRTYKCECGHVEDRDTNAAKNIDCLGRAILARGCTAISLPEALAFRQG